MKYSIVSLIALVLLLAACSEDKPTQPSAPKGSLLLSELAISIVPGGSETVTICATKPDGTPATCTIDNGDPGVATATLSDSTIQITGISYGTTNITVRSGYDIARTLPVQVYNPYVLDAGELLITYTDSFMLASDIDLYGFWKPVPPEGFHNLGSWGNTARTNPNGHYAVMVVMAKPGSDAIAFTDSFRGFASAGAVRIGMFKPIAPPGYKAMGDIVTQTSFLGSIVIPDSAVCIREDLTIPGEAGIYLQDWSDFWARWYSCWNIDQPDIGNYSEARLVQGTFLVKPDLDQPEIDPSMNVLKVELPMLAEAPYQSFVPKLDGYDTPPAETVPVMAKAMLVPCSIINDAAFNDDIWWQVANSPFYRLERQVYYKLLYHNHNQTSEMQTNSVTIRSGITTTESERIMHETSISISAETGLSFQAISGKTTATVSYKFGYETQTSVAELMETEITSSINTAPGKAAALWQKYNRYVLYRHNGTQLEPVSTWGFGIESYVTDEYPN
ncbi:MAG: hypothetical protein NTW07_12180 [candidate division Zixibacteria bacterium]|nr:hypothetical protein [candidate division Zixibacteria bacterium]